MAPIEAGVAADASHAAGAPAQLAPPDTVPPPDTVAHADKDAVKPGLGHIDSALTNLFLPTISRWYSIGASPNLLTTLGLISSVLAVYNLYHQNTRRSIAFILLRLYFDYSDGLLARYIDNQPGAQKGTSSFGDWYDHIVDVTFMVSFTWVVYKKSKHRKTHLALILAFGTLMMVQMGCIENAWRERQHEESETSISKLRKLCIFPPVMDFFDNGTFYLVLIFITVTLRRRKLLR